MYLRQQSRLGIMAHLATIVFATYVITSSFGYGQSADLTSSLDAASGLSNDRARSRAFQQIRSALPIDGQGGASQADFDSLIELITTTVAPTSWDIVGGPGAISAFPGGVYVNADGILSSLDQRRLKETAAQLAKLRKRAQSQTRVQQADVRSDSKLRFVSLPALERNIQRRWAEGNAPAEEMRLLAGLYDVHYVFVSHESQDVVIAGPAGDWELNQELRIINVDNGRPVLRLDDLVTLLRNVVHEGGQFSCSITPQEENLRRTQKFLDHSKQRALHPSARDRWIDQLRDTVGLQAVEFQGLNARTRVARVLLEADYHMKLVGMDIEPSIPEIPSYLDLIGAPPASQTVLRWWFALKNDFAGASAKRDAFDLRGQAVKLMSENELLTKLGRRIHTGGSDMLNRQFTARFTEHFGKLAKKYPIYADLENVCKLAVVASLIGKEGVTKQIQWEMLHLLDEQKYQIPLGRTPKQVPSVVNYRVLSGKHIVAGVSGGVSIQPQSALSNARRLAATRLVAQQKLPIEEVSDRELENWWWD